LQVSKQREMIDHVSIHLSELNVERRLPLKNGGRFSF
jgi:hypothetical protein